MDETKDIKEYLTKLPTYVREVIASTDWYSRVNEIGEKYSLNLEQIKNLEYEILFVLIGMEADTDFKENIKKQLKISELLVDQINGEVDNRIFFYILDLIQKKEGLIQKPRVVPRPALDSKNDLVEKPSTTPVVEQDSLRGMVPEIRPTTNLPMVEAEMPRAGLGISSSHKPVSIPRYIAPSNPLVNQPKNIIDNKLNNVVKGASSETPPASAQSTSEARQKYTIDPYREPME